MIQADAEDFLQKLVDCESPTSSQSGVRQAHSMIASRLKDLGFEIEWHRDPSGQTDDLMAAELRPEQASAEDGKFVTFVSHVDTVLDFESAGRFRKSHHEGLPVAYGPGIIDNKGGLVVLIESIRLFLANQRREGKPQLSHGIRVISSPDEESGSAAWHRIFRHYGKTSAAVLGFEPALDDGSIIRSRRGNRWYNVKIQGQEAHAGRCNGEELNAAHEAARFIGQVVALKNRIQQNSSFNPSEPREASINVGHIQGGRDRHNVVCGDILIKLDTRFSSFETRDRIHSAIEDLIQNPETKNTAGRTVEYAYEIVDDCPPFEESPHHQHLVSNLLHRISSAEGRKIEAVKAGGSGDVNHMSVPGLFILDGLGPVGGGMHTTNEFIELQSLETRIRSIAEWLPELFQFLAVADE